MNMRISGKVPAERQGSGLGIVRLVGFLKRLGLKISSDDCMGLAAEMAYNWMLSLLPGLIFLFTLFGMVNSQQASFYRVLTILRRLVPKDAYSLVQASLDALIQESNGGLAILSLLAALWTVSNGAVTVEKALNRFYKIEPKFNDFWKERLSAIIIVIGISVLMLVSTNLIVFGEAIHQFLGQVLHFPETWLNWIRLLRWTLPIFSLFVMSWFVYAIVPRTLGRRFWRNMWPGAMTFVPLWILISLLFGTYVSNMGNYGKIYGPMGAIVILMIWLYLTSLALLIGGEVNALLLAENPANAIQIGEPSGQQVRSQADG